jgi:arylsulfatase A-like enzyme
VGKDQYLVFLSADHGVAHVAGFSKEHKLPGGTFPSGEVEHALDSVVRKQFGNYRFMLSFMNNQIVFDHQLIDSVKADKKAISAFVINYLSKVEGVDRVFETKDIMTEPMAEKVRTKLANGFYPSRCGDIQILLKSGWMGGSGIGTTHGAWNPYDTHIPLLWYGWKIRSGKTNREVYMTDVAPTIAAMLRIQMPSGTTGNVIQEIF